MSESNDAPPPQPPDEPSGSPFPESSLTPPPPQPEAPPAPAEPAPAPPAPVAEPPSRPWMESSPVPPEPPAPLAPAGGGLMGGDPLAGSAPAPAAFPPGYTSPPPPGAGGDYAPPPAQTFGSTSPVAGQYVLSGWWRRAGAAIIDGILVFVIASLLAVVVGASLFSVDESGVTGVILGLLVWVVFLGLGTLVYTPVMMGRTNGKTLGRMATGIRVVRADGQPITVGFAALREVGVKWLLVGIISAITVGIVWLVDVLWPLWDDENRALHDFVVNTRTVMDGG